MSDKTTSDFVDVFMKSSHKQRLKYLRAFCAAIALISEEDGNTEDVEFGKFLNNQLMRTFDLRKETLYEGIILSILNRKRGNLIQLPFEEVMKIKGTVELCNPTGSGALIVYDADADCSGSC
jgi:hypothetical protein